MFSLIYAWTNDIANSRIVGDLKRRRAHFDVTLMVCRIKTRYDTKYPQYILLEDFVNAWIFYNKNLFYQQQPLLLTCFNFNHSMDM